MKAVRGIAVALVFSTLMLVVFENFDVLSQQVSLRLNLYFFEVRTIPAALGVLLILFFLAGFIVSSMYGLYDRFRLRMTIRKQAAVIDKMTGELKSGSKTPPPA